MAIRLRVNKVTGQWMALCAVEYPEEYGDIYLDDAHDHALREKYLADYESEGLIDGSRIAALEAERDQARAERDAAREALDAAKKEAADWKEEAIAMRARS